MSTIKRKILITCALPYANGSIHIGHILEHIQADIWARYHRMRGHEVWFVSGDDAHGTAIMLKAEKLGISPHQLIDNILQEHKLDFLNFNISHDNYYSTHSKENLYFVKKIFSILQNKNLIQEKVISQFYDNEKKMFLPDRFIKGTCSYCKAKNQFGDTCEVCSATYEPMNLIDPISVISGKKPILKKTNHLYFNLPVFTDILKIWMHSGILEKSVLNKAKEWFDVGLKMWNISRDAPYFGFNIPGVLEKYFYVWLDAPIGYISFFKNLCDQHTDLNFYDMWNISSKYELYHFIGKDIIYFHTLFWPAILEATNFRKPNGIFVHGYVTMNGLKLSKSRGFLIKASDWLKYFDSDSLRYYFASKLSYHFNDIEIDLEDFMYKINNDIVNKLVNLAARNASFINKYFNNYLSNSLYDIKFYKNFIHYAFDIEQKLENRDFSSVVRLVMELVDIANQYINLKKPWKLINNLKELHMIVTFGLNLFRVVMTFLKPIIPNLAQKTESFLMVELTWEGINIPLLSHKIATFQPLYQRITIDRIDDLLNNCEFF